MNWKMTVSLVGAAAIFALACPVQATALAGGSPGDLTQRQYLELLARASARRASLPANPTATDYVNWAVARGVIPEGGWRPDAPLTRAVYAQTLAQLYGVPARTDPVRALMSEGVVVPSTNLISRTTVLAELSDPGFRSGTADGSRHPATPINPGHKVAICHNRQTIEVSQSALAAHLAHGDYLGACNNRRDDERRENERRENERRDNERRGNERRGDDR